MIWTLLSIACGLLAVRLLAPGWGPGIHVKLASQLLDTMPDRLPEQQVELLDRHRDCFQYGCIAADIINIKQYGGMANHCHNWSIEERLYELVESDEERVFVWGYLCHLAADVIAHNHFVPYQLVHGFPPYVLGHTYWEARADSIIDESTWDMVDALRLDPDLDSNDQLINRAVPRKALSMASNKLIFNHVLLARAKRSWRDIMDKMRRQNPIGTIDEPFLDRCLEHCLENMFATFDARRLFALRERDPRGHEALRNARRLRRKLIKTHGDRRRAAEPSRAAADEWFGLDAR